MALVRMNRCITLRNSRLSTYIKYDQTLLRKPSHRKMGESPKSATRVNSNGVKNVRFGRDPAKVLVRWVHAISSLVSSFELTQRSREEARQVGHFAPLFLRESAD